MGRAGAIPRQFGNVHPRFLSPGFSTIWMGLASMIVYILLSVTSHDNLIADAFTSLSLTIAFYYGITGSPASSSTAGTCSRASRTSS